MSLTRLDMVDVGGKGITAREAVARGEVLLSSGTIHMIREGRIPKGDVLACARVAGILAVKKTPQLIPMCHPLSITQVKVDFEVKDNLIEITSRTKAKDRTGVEMEALTGVVIAALTIYDMCKGVDKGISISNIRVVMKKGGRSGIKGRVDDG
jgi:cyclic pyranopterin phosphate synthase